MKISRVLIEGLMLFTASCSAVALVSGRWPSPTQVEKVESHFDAATSRLPRPPADEERQKSPNDYAKPWRNLSDDELLGMLREDVVIWSVSPNRTEFISAVTEKLTKALGAKGAILAIVRILDAGRVNHVDGSAIVTSASIAAFQAGKPAKAEQIPLLTEAGSVWGSPILAVCATTLSASSLGDFERQILAMMRDARWTVDSGLTFFAIATSVSLAQVDDPSEVAAFILSEDKRLKTGGMISLVLSYLGQSRPEFALKVGVKVGVGLAMTDINRVSALTRVIQLSPEAMVEISKSVAEPARSRMLVAFLDNTVKSPLELEAVAKNFRPQDLTPDGAARLASKLLIFGGGRVRAWMEGMSQQAQAKMLNETYKTLTTGGSPDQALAWLDAAGQVKGIDPANVSQAIKNAAFSQSATTSQLLKYCSSAPSKQRAELQRAVYSGALYNVGIKDPSRLPEAVNALPTDFRKQLLTTAAQQLAFQAPTKALEWYQNCADPEEKRGIRLAILETPSSKTLPLETRQTWLLETVAEAPNAGGLTRSIDALLQDMAFSDGSSAAAFVEQLPASGARDQATQYLARIWAIRDPASASEWIVQMPPGGARDGALTELVQCSRDDPEGALANASAISNKTQRLGSAATVISFWQGTDPSKAAYYLANSPLTDDDKAELSKLIH